MLIHVMFNEIIIIICSLFICSSVDPFSPTALGERESQAAREQMRQRWESLRLELKTKLQLLQNTLEQDHKQPVKEVAVHFLFKRLIIKVKRHLTSDLFFFCNLQVYSRPSRVATSGPIFKGEAQANSSSLKTLYVSFRQTIEEMTTQVLFS